MRNKTNEVTEFSEIVDIIARCDTIRIAMFDEPYPYIVPVNFGEEVVDGQIVFYIHTGYEGKKNELLKKNPNVAFEMDCNHELYYRESNMSCNFRYESVVGTGRMEIVPEEEKDKALTLFMNHYHPETVKYHAMSAQIKTVIDRFHGIDDSLRSTDKKAMLIVSATSTEKHIMDGVVGSYRETTHYLGWQDAGIFLSYGCYSRADMEKTDYAEKAYLLGRSVR